MTVLELDNKIERIIEKTVKYYYSDWKNYDRPKYMVMKAHKEPAAILITRTCGTYIFSESESKKGSAKTIIDYYTNNEPANIYFIDFNKGTVKLTHKGIA